MKTSDHESQESVCKVTGTERVPADIATIAAVGQPLLDVIVPCDTALLERNGFVPGTHEFLTSQAMSELLVQIPVDRMHQFSGGSALNSVKSARILGLGGSYVGLMGSDPAGGRVRALLLNEGIKTPLDPTQEYPTGMCISLITPDGERTMRTNLGASSLLDARHIERVSFREHAWVILEGYLLVSSDSNRSALSASLAALAATREKAVFSLASEYIAKTQREAIFASILPRIGLFIANEREACALTETSSVNEALEILEKYPPGLVVTCGERGAWTYMNRERFFTPAHTSGTTVVDTTGAGDVYLGAFLAGLSMRLSPRVAANGASRMAALVVSKYGSDLPQIASDLWADVTGSCSF